MMIDPLRAIVRLPAGPSLGFRSGASYLPNQVPATRIHSLSVVRTKLKCSPATSTDTRSAAMTSPLISMTLAFLVPRLSRILSRMADSASVSGTAEGVNKVTPSVVAMADAATSVDASAQARRLRSRIFSIVASGKGHARYDSKLMEPWPAAIALLQRPPNPPPPITWPPDRSRVIVAVDLEPDLPTSELLPEEPHSKRRDAIDDALLDEIAARGTVSVRRLAEAIGMSSNGTWQRLARLRTAGLVELDADGWQLECQN